ncbi:MAG: hypothetical protein JXJ22_17785 [Bacteroidales bacterium]|nr:hypothetical protein [Bacteroidales bacterium]
MKFYYIFISILITVFFTGCDNNEISSLQSERFAKYFGGNLEDFGSEVISTAEGGYAIVGTITTLEAGSEMCLIITDEFGNTVSPVHLFGGSFNDFGYSLKQLPDGGFILLGSFQKVRQGEKDMFLVRTNFQGDTVWTRKFGGSQNEEGYNLQLTNDGNLIMVGYTQSFGNGEEDVWLVKTDLNGKLLWLTERTFGWAGEDVGKCVKETSDGYVITGYSKNQISNSTDFNLLLIRTNTNGYLINQNNTIGGSDDDFGNSVFILPQGDILVAGSIGSTDIIGNGLSDIYLCRTNSNFTVLWEKYYGNNMNDYGNAVSFVDNEVVVFGTLGTSGNTSNMVLITADPESGYEKSRKIIGESTQMEGNSFSLLDQEGYIFTGSNKVNDNSNITLIKLPKDQ